MVLAVVFLVGFSDTGPQSVLAAEKAQKKPVQKKPVKNAASESLPVEQALFDIASLVYLWDTAIEYGANAGQEYNTDKYKSWTESEKVDALVSSMCLKNAIGGAGFGFFGAVGIPGGIVTSLGLQVKLLTNERNFCTCVSF